MNELQKKLLEMLQWLDSFIRENNMVYYAIGGTLIGAARHSGFIPWDDDIDIAMPRPDYEKFCHLLSKPTDHYVVESPEYGKDDFLYTFAKFYDTETTMTESLRHNITRGVSIDVFPLDGMGGTMEEAIKNYKRINRYNMFLMTRICAYRKDRKWYKNAAIFASRAIPNFLVNERQLVNKIDTINKSISFDESAYISLPMSTYTFKDIHKKALLGDRPRELSFEGLSLYVPQSYDEYLRDTFGNWRELPPEEKRVTAHDYIELNLNSSYMD